MSASKSISKSLLNEVGILENLAKQENFVSNSLGNKVGIFSNLAFLASAQAYSAVHPPALDCPRAQETFLASFPRQACVPPPPSWSRFFRGHDRPLPSPRPPPP